MPFPLSPSALQVFIVKGLCAPQHYYLIVHGKVLFLQNTGWKRITFFFKDSWPQTEEEAPLLQSLPHISSAASPSPASGQEVGSMVGSFHFTL